VPVQGLAAEPETSDKHEKREHVTQSGVEWNSSIIATWIFGSSATLHRAVELDAEIDRFFALALGKRHNFLTGIMCVNLHSDT
jgi:hypothetical protein